MSITNEAEQRYPSTYTHDGVTMDYPLHKFQREAYCKGATRSAWVSVDEPPEEEIDVLIWVSCDEFEQHETGCYYPDTSEWSIYGIPDDSPAKPTHWQPLPAKPQPPKP